MDVELHISVKDINNTVKGMNFKQTKKIIMLSWEFPPRLIGGLGRHVYELSKELVRTGWEIHVITAGLDEQLQYEKMDGVHVHRVFPLNHEDNDFLYWVAGLNLAIADRAIRLADEHGFVLVHAHDWLVGAAALSVKELLHLPLVSTIHATEYGRNNGIFTELQRFIHSKEEDLVKMSDHLIVCSRAMKQEIKRVFRVDHTMISVIPNGVAKCDVLADKNDRQPGLPFVRNRTVIFSLGRMVTEKGFDLLIEAAFKMKQRRIDVCFIIAGTGPLLADYRKTVKALALEDTVFFIGFVDDELRNSLFAASDFVVFPSRYEPFGIAALEAMMAGKPVIAAKVGGLKEFIHHKRTGLLMEPDQSESFIKQALNLIKNKSEAERIGLAGKRYVEEYFSWKQVASLTETVYKYLIDDKINGFGGNEMER